MSSSYQIYRSTTIGLTLDETLQELVYRQIFPPHLVNYVFNVFDKIINDKLMYRINKDKKEPSLIFKGHLLSYRSCDQVWTLMFDSITFSSSTDSTWKIILKDPNEKLKIIACPINLPSLPCQFLFGNLLQTGLLRGKPTSLVYAELRDKLGDCYLFQFGFSRWKCIGNIADAQYIFANRNIYDQGDWFVDQLGALIPNALITLKGAKFKRHAAITMALFRKSKINPMFDTIVECTDKLLENWRAFPSDHIHTDIVEQSQNLLLEIFGLIAFDYDFQTLDDSKNNELTEALMALTDVINKTIYLSNFMFKIYLKFNYKYKKSNKILEKYLYRMIEQEFNQTEELRMQRKKTSLIASLVGSLQTDEQEEAKKSEEDKKGLSKHEILDEMLMFLIAGYETTSTALSWAIHLLSLHPNVEQKLKNELIENNIDQTLTVEKLDALIYFDCFIKEVLRFSPTLDATSRSVVVDDRLPNSGVQVYKGDQVMIPLSVFARDHRYWSIDPNLFYPERFLSDDKNHKPLAFQPFGYGHRQCIGQDLARFELKVILLRFMQRITFIDGGSSVNSGGYVQKLTIMPKHVGVKIKFD